MPTFVQRAEQRRAKPVVIEARGNTRILVGEADAEWMHRNIQPTPTEVIPDGGGNLTAERILFRLGEVLAQNVIFHPIRRALNGGDQFY